MNFLYGRHRRCVSRRFAAHSNERRENRSSQVPIPEHSDASPEPAFAPLSFTGGGLFLRLQQWLNIAPPGNLGWRAALAILLCWGTPMLLALFAFARTGRLPALTHEAGFHARFLVTVPLLLAAETWLGYRIAAISTSFVPRRMLDGAAAASWTGLARRIERVGAASITELAIAVAVWGIALLDALRSRPSPLLKWLAPAAIGGAGEPLAQWWYVVVSQPVLLFLLARWLWRWLLWSAALVGLLWMHPRLNAKHPDRAGGTAFLTITLDAYQLVALAVGAAFAGTWADAIVKTGAEAATLAPMLVGYVAGALVIGFAAFLPFTPLLIHSRRRDTARYAVFAAQYLQAFDDKYLSSRSRDAVLGSSDIQSLSDLHNSYVIAADMRMTVFSPRDVSRVLAMAVLPTLILMIAIVPANEIAKRLLIFVIP